MTLKKQDIAKKISYEVSLTSDTSLKLTNQLIFLIKDNINKKNNVKVSNFGAFIVKTSPKRLGRNPKTKESYIIEPRTRVAFLNSKKVRSTLNWTKSWRVFIYP